MPSASGVTNADGNCAGEAKGYVSLSLLKSFCDKLGLPDTAALSDMFLVEHTTNQRQARFVSVPGWNHEQQTRGVGDGHGNGRHLDAGAQSFLSPVLPVAPHGQIWSVGCRVQVHDGQARVPTRMDRAHYDPDD